MIMPYTSTQTETKKILEKYRQHWDILQRIEQHQEYSLPYDLVEESIEAESDTLYLLRGALAILGSFLMHLLIGSINRWPIISPFIASYYKMHSDAQLTLTQNDGYFFLGLLFMGLAMNYGFKLAERFGAMLIMSVCLLGMAISLLAASLMPNYFGSYDLMQASSWSITAPLDSFLVPSFW